MSSATNLEEIKAGLPDHAKDLRLNLGAIGSPGVLGPEAHWGTLVASAIVSGEGELLNAVETAAAEFLSDDALDAARAAAALMGMNNVYYRFLHLVEDATYDSLPARLRMQRMAKPGVEKATFELWSLAVSAITGCGRCITSHEATLRGEGVSPAAIQEAVRIASVIRGVAGVLQAESARSRRPKPATA